MLILNKSVFRRAKNNGNIHNLKNIYNNLFNQLPASCIICDTEGVIIQPNKFVSTLTKYSQDELKEKSIFDFMQIYKTKFNLEYLEKMKNGSTITFKCNLTDKFSDNFAVKVTIIPILNKQDLIGMYVVILEQSGVKEVNTYEELDNINISLEKTERRFRSLLYNSNDIFEIINLDGTIKYISPSIERLAGLKPEDRIGENVFEYLDEKGRATLNKMLDLALKDPSKIIKGDIMFETKNEDTIYLEVTMKNGLQEPYIEGIILNWRDITRRIEMQKKIAYISTYDELTGLPNRKFFRKKLRNQCKVSRQNNSSFALMIIGIDGFKYINDSLGYKVGDQLVVEIANRLKSHLNKKGFISRYIGDQFAIIVPNLNTLEEYEQFAKNIVELFSTPFKFDIYDLNINVSLGGSICPDDSQDFDCLKNHALIALLRAKNEGSNNYKFYSPQMNIENYKQFILRNDLKNSVKNNQFKVYYQPLVNLKNNDIIAAEALIRWEHPVWGLVYPNEFIPLAEETGFIINLGNWMLRQVCINYKKWLKNGLLPIKVSINYSSKQFFENNFVENIKNTIEEFELDPHFLIIEITEGALINNSEQVISHINDLRELGIQIAIDDFGTGFSSLSYLNMFDIDILKIDKSFIKNIPSNEVSTKITNSIIGLAKDLKVKLVAEGIENWDQLSYLRRLNCYTGQGYIYSKPVPLDEFEKILLKRKCKPITINTTLVKPKEERRKFFRIDFPYFLEGDITILEINGKKIKVGNTSVLIKNMGPGGLCFISDISFPIKKDIILQFKTELMDKEIKVYGCPVWSEEVDYSLYKYGVEFTFSENDRTELIKILNNFQVKLRNIPGFKEGRFIAHSYSSYFRRKENSNQISQ